VAAAGGISGRRLSSSSLSLTSDKSGEKGRLSSCEDGCGGDSTTGNLNGCETLLNALLSGRTGLNILLSCVVRIGTTLCFGNNCVLI